ncbi:MULTISPECIES: DUF1257 domain-containing protein [Pseudanabaena]|uniref:DUF1257 domain-containing protein n=2 Tax=Pseudanabaena TaxID=1152 RepID=L8MWJ0_9CYAN|nr:MULTISPECIES: DUF1257 domain-containing protein [Pseudanabaena]ELS30810.1 protein of unknown function DUF1257 [Pseudanabaena biceps PCC 7429]MDG3496921.1 DUF1257 domain-containing protein [Pseudanabaena catenata USMAC16]
MSHFTTIAIEIKNGDLLEKSLQELGYPVKRNTLVRGYLGNSTHAEYVIPMPNAYDIGFRKLGDRYELIADMWGVATNVEELLGAITQQYATNKVLQSAAQQGFAIEQQEILEDGTIRIVIGRWS